MLHLVNRKEIKLEQAIAALTSQPANILGINKGTLSAGSDADICILDLDSSNSVDPSLAAQCRQEHTVSKDGNCPDRLPILYLMVKWYLNEIHFYYLATEDTERKK